jgi:hypothetical protein
LGCVIIKDDTTGKISFLKGFLRFLLVVGSLVPGTDEHGTGIADNEYKK